MITAFPIPDLKYRLQTTNMNYVAFVSTSDSEGRNFYPVDFQRCSFDNIYHGIIIPGNCKALIELVRVVLPYSWTWHPCPPLRKTSPTIFLSVGPYLFVVPLYVVSSPLHVHVEHKSCLKTRLSCNNYFTTTDRLLIYS